MSLLLDANRDAPGIKDNVRRCTHTPCMPLARCYPTYEYVEAVCALRTAVHTQGMKMSLHHAAVNGAPFDVMKLLLDANPEAATAADKARGSAQLLVPLLSPALSHRPVALMLRRAHASPHVGR
jgi:hypothetical protein